MQIAVIGRGNVGGGLAQRWQRAGHTVESFGRDGGDAASAEVVLVAVPAASIRGALARVSGIAGKLTIDATNEVGNRDEQFPSLAAMVKSIIGGATAKAFNLNFAAVYDQIDDQSSRPSTIFAADPDAREVTEKLIRDAGYDPVYAGNLDAARSLEDHLPLMFAINRAGMGPFFYRIAPPGEL